MLVPHYDIQSALIQKIDALASRAVIQARDIFDLYVLSPQIEEINKEGLGLIKKEKLIRAYENIFEVDFDEFKDAVVSYLCLEDQETYGNLSSWEEVRLRVADFIERLRNRYA